jgi:hypothetical protein
VYAFEAIEELCLKPRNFKVCKAITGCSRGCNADHGWLLCCAVQDLLTDEAFNKKTDLLTIQDPSNPALRDVNQFHYIKTNERLPVSVILFCVRRCTLLLRVICGYGLDRRQLRRLLP